MMYVEFDSFYLLTGTRIQKLKHKDSHKRRLVPPPMGTCPSAHSVVERGSPGNVGDSQAAPDFGKCGVLKPATALANRGAGEGEDLEAHAARRALMSGVQRWFIDVSEWGELSTDQASETNKEAGRQGGNFGLDSLSRTTVWVTATATDDRAVQNRPNYAPPMLYTVQVWCLFPARLNRLSLISPKSNIANTGSGKGCWVSCLRQTVRA